MAICGAKGIGTSYYMVTKFFKLQFPLKIIDRNQTAMMLDLRKQNFSSNAIFLVNFWKVDFFRLFSNSLKIRDSNQMTKRFL